MNDKEIKDTLNETRDMDTPVETEAVSQTSDANIAEDEEEVELIDIITADEEEIEEQEYDLKAALLESDRDELIDVIESAYAIDVAIALEEFEDDELLSFADRLDTVHIALNIKE
jgi:hypothetical protein